MFRNLIVTLLLLLTGTHAMADATYQTAEEFLDEAFAGSVPEPEVVWLTGQRREVADTILGHRYPTLRIRYWRSRQRSAWVLEEVGKEQPITTGVVVDKGRIERIRVLVFRESRGWEIRHPFFTDQFKGAGLINDQELDRNIDGISGATLSVRAMQKIARLALYLDSVAGARNVAPAP
jgi:hypothetical protein